MDGQLLATLFLRGLTLQSDFLTLDNTEFDLGALKARRNASPTNNTSVSLLALSLREALVVQPPLAPNERLPKTFLLPENQPALSVNPIETYIYKNDIELYIHPRHEKMYELCYSELHDSDFVTTHGTSCTLRLGCQGPICRRIRNVQRYQAARLRALQLTPRTSYPPYSHWTTMTERYKGLKRKQPVYAAVEPLLETLTCLSHQQRRPVMPNQISTVYLRLFSNEIRNAYLSQVYTTAIKTD